MVVLGLAGIGVFSSESPETLAAFVEQTGVTFPILQNDATYFEYDDPDFAISPYPLDVIVDQDGNIAYLRREYDAEAMLMTIDRLLAR